MRSVLVVVVLQQLIDVIVYNLGIKNRQMIFIEAPL